GAPAPPPDPGRRRRRGPTGELPRRPARAPARRGGPASGHGSGRPPLVPRPSPPADRGSSCGSRGRRRGALLVVAADRGLVAQAQLVADGSEAFGGGPALGLGVEGGIARRGRRRCGLAGGLAGPVGLLLVLRAGRGLAGPL